MKIGRLGGFSNTRSCSTIEWEQKDYAGALEEASGGGGGGVGMHYSTRETDNEPWVGREKAIIVRRRETGALRTSAM